MALRSPTLKLVGLHLHLGSPIFELEPYEIATRTVLEFASRFREEGLTLQEFSPGGGFAIAYTRDQAPPPISDYAEAIVSTMADSCASSAWPFPG